MLWRIADAEELERAFDRWEDDHLTELAGDSTVALGEMHARYLMSKAYFHGQAGETALEREYHDSARVLLEALVQERPEEPYYRSHLGIAYAILGRKEDAVREGEKGVQLLPISKDPFFYGPDRVYDLAQVYLMVGERDAAVEQLELLVPGPGFVTGAHLKVDPFWDPLREHPRFQQLVASEN